MFQERVLTENGCVPETSHSLGVIRSEGKCCTRPPCPPRTARRAAAPHTLRPQLKLPTPPLSALARPRQQMNADPDAIELSCDQLI